MAAAAFSIKAVTSFMSSCLELGSDLTEVQNVVDTAFPNMSKQADDFAKSCMESFGLSETMAKKFMGTFGAMSNSFGFTEKEALEMSETLTGLAGDVASFYNLDPTEAYTKIKSVFTGETESLKELGVVMTQTALDQYALANGYGKTTAKMTEQEKVALRYAFVQEQLSMATGDFIKTQDSWANQTRILSLRIDSLKASLGKGFIALFSPIVKGINWVLSNLQVLADSFASLMEFIIGYSGDTGSNAANSVANDLSSASDSANDLSSGLTDAGSSGEKAAEKIKRAFAGVDTINKLSFGDSDSSNSNDNSNSSNSVTNVADAVSFPKATSEASVFEKMLSGIIDEFKRLSSLFKSGFEFGLGNSLENINKIKENILSVGESLKNIFTSPEVIQALKNYAESVAFYLGTVTGSIASIGITIATLLTGSISKYLEDNEEMIKDCLVKWFDIRSRGLDIESFFLAAVADIASVFAGDTAISIGSNFIGAILNGAMNSLILFEKIGVNIAEMIYTPIIENKDKIKAAIENTLKPIDTVLETLKKSVDNTFQKIFEIYDNSIEPMFSSFKKGISEITGTLLDGYNKYIAPVLQKIADKFSDVFTKKIQPMVDKFLETIGSIADLLSALWKNILQPIVNWIIKNVMPVLADILDFLGSTIVNAIGVLCDFLNGLFTVIKSVIDVFTGLINGMADFISWVKKLPEKISLTITGIKDKAFDVVKDAWNSIQNSTVVKTMKAIKDKAFDSLKNLYNGVKNSTAIKTLKSALTSAFSSAKKTWDAIKNGTFTKTLKASVSSALSKAKKIWDSLKSKTLTLGMKLTAAVGNMKNFVNGIIKAINKNVISKIYIKIPDKVPFIGGNKIGPPPNIPLLAQGGYVKANQPQLAMIGDNRHYGEIVAPENKMLDMINTALQMQKENGNVEGVDTIIYLLKELIDLVKNLSLKADIDIKKLSILIENAKKERQMIGG